MFFRLAAKMPLTEINKAQLQLKTKELIVFIGQYIKSIRRDRKITQQDLAFYIFSDKCLISQIERGSSKGITLATLVKICDVLDIPFKNLFQDQGHDKKPYPRSDK